jgi:predicted aspartyl protease
MNIRFGFLLAVLLVPPSGFAQIPENTLLTSAQNQHGAISHVTIPFKLYESYLIVVQGSLGTLDRLNLLIDTGASPTKVDPRIANKLGLTVAGSHRLALFNQNLEVAQVVLPSLQLGPIRAESLPGVIVDLSCFEKILGVRIDAVVGFDVLSLSSFSIDYRGKKIVFGAIEPSALSVPFETGPPVLTVELHIQDEPLRLLVDTGSAELVLFECQLPSRLRQLQASSLKRSFFNGAGQEVELVEVGLRGVRLGTADLELQKGLTANDNANCGRPFNGVVGVTRLGLKWVAFDFENRRFSWKN